MTRPRGFCDGRGPVGDLDIDDHAFQVVPVGAAGGFVAKHAVDGFFCSFIGSFGIARDGWRFGFRRFGSGGNHHVHGDLAIEGLHEVVAAAVVKNSDYGGMSTHDGANDAAFGAAILTDGNDVDQHAVPMHGVADGVGGDENISREL